jgi:hypothetical protein
LLALAVHPEVMDCLGWEALGAPVKLFPVFSEEAKREAQERLLPSRLARPASGCAGRLSRSDFNGGSPFSVGTGHLIESLIRRTVSGKTIPLSELDHLVLGCLGIQLPAPDPHG